MTAFLAAALVYPSLNAIMSQQVPANAQGELQGAVASLYSIASVIGPPLMTHLFGHFSSPTSGIQLPGAAFPRSSLLVVARGSCSSPPRARDAARRAGWPPERGGRADAR